MLPAYLCYGENSFHIIASHVKYINLFASYFLVQCWVNISKKLGQQTLHRSSIKQTVIIIKQKRDFLLCCTYIVIITSKQRHQSVHCSPLRLWMRILGREWGRETKPFFLVLLLTQLFPVLCVPLPYVYNAHIICPVYISRDVTGEMINSEFVYMFERKGRKREREGERKKTFVEDNTNNNTRNIMGEHNGPTSSIQIIRGNWVVCCVAYDIKALWVPRLC